MAERTVTRTVGGAGRAVVPAGEARLATPPAPSPHQAPHSAPAGPRAAGSPRPADRRRVQLPRRTWLLVAAGAMTAVAVAPPWFVPEGRLADGSTLPATPLNAWQLPVVALVGVLLLAATGAAAAALLLLAPRHGGTRHRHRRRLARLGLLAGLLTLLGVYLDWRAVPAASGVDPQAWAAAGTADLAVTVGAQPALWLVLAGGTAVLLVASSLLGITLRVVALGYLGALVVLPVCTVVLRAFASGADAVWQVVTSDPEFLHAVQLTVVVAGIAVVLNTVFGLGIALLLTRYEFPGRRLLSTLVDLPLAISPVVVGVALILVYGQAGWLGERLESAGFPIIFATPGMVLATMIVSLPLVVRAVVPVLDEAGLDQEQAAQSLGAGALQRFRRITLPTIRWALAYGVVLSLARSIGEFGAVRVVSQSVAMESQTVTLFINREYEQLGAAHKDNAFIGSFVLMVVAVLFIVVIALLRPKDES